MAICLTLYWALFNSFRSWASIYRAAYSLSYDRCGNLVNVAVIIINSCTVSRSRICITILYSFVLGILKISHCTTRLNKLFIQLCGAKQKSSRKGEVSEVNLNVNQEDHIKSQPISEEILDVVNPKFSHCFHYPSVTRY